MLTDGRTDGQTDDGRKVITIAHPEQSSGELKSLILGHLKASRTGNLLPDLTEYILNLNNC